MEWRERNEENLNPLEQEFLTAGVVLQKQEQEEEEQRRQSELEQAQALAAAQEQRAREQTRAAKRLRWLAVALFLIVLIAGWVAWQAREGARRNQALLAQNYWSSAVSASKQSEWLGTIHFSARAATEERDPLRLKAAVLHTQAFTRSVFLGTAVTPAHGAVFSQDESLVLTWSGDGTARLWRAGDGSPVGQPMKHEKGVLGATFNRDESLVLTWSGDGTARLWRAADGSAVGQPMKHEGLVLGATFNRDESLVLTWSEDGTARLWRAADGSAVGQPMKHEQEVRGATFNRDESLVLTWSEDGTARLWRATDGSPVGQPLKHGGKVWGATFNQDGSLVLTWSENGTARLWNIRADYDFPTEHWPLFVEVATGTAMDDAGNVRALSADKWQQRKKDYVQIAEEHLKTCHYREANLYVKQKELWEGGRSEAGQPAHYSESHLNE